MPTEEKEVKDPRTVAAEDAAHLAKLLVAAAKRRADAALTPGEVYAALEDAKKADAAVEKAKEDAKTVKTAIKNEELAEKSRLATAEAASKVAEEAAKDAEKEAKDEASKEEPIA